MDFVEKLSIVFLGRLLHLEPEVGYSRGVEVPSELKPQLLVDQESITTKEKGGCVGLQKNRFTVRIIGFRKNRFAIRIIGSPCAKIK